MRTLKTVLMAGVISVFLSSIIKAEEPQVQIRPEVQPFEMNMALSCGDTVKFINGLKQNYGEEVTFVSPSENELGHKLYHTLWINHQSNTWTFTVTNDDRNVTCVLASGDTAMFKLPTGI